MLYSHSEHLYGSEERREDAPYGRSHENPREAHPALLRSGYDMQNYPFDLPTPLFDQGVQDSENGRGVYSSIQTTLPYSSTPFTGLNTPAFSSPSLNSSLFDPPDPYSPTSRYSQMESGVHYDNGRHAFEYPSALLNPDYPDSSFGFGELDAVHGYAQSDYSHSLLSELPSSEWPPVHPFYDTSYPVSARPSRSGSLHARPSRSGSLHARGKLNVNAAEFVMKKSPESAKPAEGVEKAKSEVVQATQSEQAVMKEHAAVSEKPTQQTQPVKQDTPVKPVMPADGTKSAPPTKPEEPATPEVPTEAWKREERKEEEKSADAQTSRADEKPVQRSEAEEKKEASKPTKQVEEVHVESSMEKAEVKEGIAEPQPKKEKKKRPSQKGGKSAKPAETPSKVEKKHAHTETKSKKKKEGKKKEEKIPLDVTLSPTSSLSLLDETPAAVSSFFHFLWHQVLVGTEPDCRFHK